MICISCIALQHTNLGFRTDETRGVSGWVFLRYRLTARTDETRGVSSWGNDSQSWSLSSRRCIVWSLARIRWRPRVERKRTIWCRVWRRSRVSRCYGVVFVVREILWFAVHRRRGGDDDALDVVVAGGFEDLIVPWTLNWLTFLGCSMLARTPA